MKNSYVISGAGSGIGRAIAMTLSALPGEPDLILLGRRLETLAKTRSLIQENQGNHITLIDADLRDPLLLKDKFSEIDFSETDLKGIIACAGLAGENTYGPDDRWDLIIDTNLSGTYHLVELLMPELRKAKNDFRHVIVISSILARIGVPKYSAYCASKAGLLGLVRSWAAEFSQDRILVNAICPGWVDTEMAREGIENFSSSQQLSIEEGFRRQMSAVPLGKMSSPTEIASLVGYLVANQQVSITGQAIDINNGAWMG